MAEPSPTPLQLPSQDVLRVLGDNTRYAIYLELARSVRPLTTAEIAQTLGLHPNTVRPHLDRMREVGLLDVTTVARGEVGRPQHRYSLATDAPALGFEPPAFPVLARMLLRLAASAELAALGFDPESVVDEHGATIAFTRCPFRELAESNPDLVCGLHRGLIDGFADQRGDALVLEFHDLADRSPCQVEIAPTSR